MKNPTAKTATANDEILPEYDLRDSRPNPYAAGNAKGSPVITLDPDVAEVFPSSQEANQALRALAQIIRARPTRRPRASRAAASARSSEPGHQGSRSAR